MKIYNEVVSIFDEVTGLWETTYEDSFEYNGSVAMAQGGMPSNATAINTADTIADTRKITAGYFTDGDGTMGGIDIYTGSLGEKPSRYYFNVNQKNAETNKSQSETQFSVIFGHHEGSGSDTYGDSTTNPNTLNGETEGIYDQLAHTLLHENEMSGGFIIGSSGTSKAGLGTGSRDPYIYAIVGKRERFKDRLNKKAWTLQFSGSNTGNTAGLELVLTDDSKTVAATATPGGPRYNIVSGALGVVDTAASDTTYGWFYPEMGCMIFSGTHLSASIPGGNSYNQTLTGGITASALTTVGAPTTGTQICGSADSLFDTELSVGDWIEISSATNLGATTQSLRTQIAGISSSANMFLEDAWTGVSNSGSYSGSAKGSFTSTVTASFSYNVTDNYSRTGSDGFAPNLSGKANSKNALRLINCMRNVNGTTLRLRSEEDQTQENYFCRIRAEQYNFSANPTFTSGSKNKIRNSDMHGDPNTFITGLGLYNSAGQMLAIAKLSKPLLKNFAAEATIKVKLTY